MGCEMRRCPPGQIWTHVSHCECVCVGGRLEGEEGGNKRNKQFGDAFGINEKKTNKLSLVRIVTD